MYDHLGLLKLFHCFGSRTLHPMLRKLFPMAMSLLLSDESYYIILFFSPSGIKSLQKNFPDFKQDANTYIGAFGPTTKKAVKNAGFRLDISAPTQQAKSMVEALDIFLKEKLKEANAR